MSKNLELKKQVVSDIVKKFQDAQSVIVVKYSGLTVEQVTGCAPSSAPTALSTAC